MNATTSHQRPHARRRRAPVAAALIALAVLAPAAARAQTTEPTQAPEAVTPDATAAAETAPAPTAPAAAAPARSVRVVEARVSPGVAYYYGMKKVRLALTLAAKGATDLRIDIVRNKSGILERSIIQNNVPPNSRVLIPWDGLSGSGTQVRGKLRVIIRGASGKPIPIAKRYAARGKKKGGPRMRFAYFDHIFPVRGKHTYGDGIGADRGDHTHQGQDLSAACGTKLVAAQAGTVQVNAYQAGGAGYYVVIDEVGSEIDTVYMHMLTAPALTAGQVVVTGQVIGQVGNTGSSNGCHLHFEMWSGPGWYEGGSFLDPAPSLRAWDKYS